MMKLILLFTFFLASAVGVAQVENRAYETMLRTLLKHSVPEVSVAEARATENVVFLDARETGEFEVSHIRGAVQVGYDRFDLSKVAALRKDQKIIVYCSVGYRSERVAEKLLAVGFTDVSNLYGGIFEWKNQGAPVVNKSGQTEQVHAYSRTWGIWLRRGEKVYD